jgi:hypothetical protein
VLALARPHPQSGEAIDERDAVEPFLDGVLYVLELHVLVEIHERHALRVVVDRVGVAWRRPWMPVHLRPGRLALPDVTGGIEPGTLTVAYLVLGPVDAANASGGEDPVSEVGGDELVQLLRVAQSATGLGQQGGVRGPSDAHGDPIATDLGGPARDGIVLHVERRDHGPPDTLLCWDGLVDAVAGVDRDAGVPHGLAELRLFAPWAQVDHGGDLDAGPEEIQHHPVGVAVGGEDDGSLKRLDGVAVDQALRRRPEHDAGQVVVPEDRGLLHRSAGDDDGPGPHLGDPVLPVDERYPVFLEVRARHGIRPVFDVGAFLDPPEQFGESLIRRRVGALGVGEGPAGPGVLVDEDDPSPGLAGRRRRREPGRTGADHEHVGEPVALAPVAPLLAGCDVSQPGGLAYEPLVVREEPGRFVERLVVEADGQESREAVVDLPEIPLEPADCVDRPELLPFLERRHVAADVQ